MSSNVSFRSTFLVNNQNNNQHNFNMFTNYAYDKESKSSGIKTIFKDKFEGNNYSAKTTLIVPDEIDNEIETFCKNKGISFTKLKTEELLNPRTITDRIAEAPKGYQIAYVDSEKLENLIGNQISNINHCEEDFDKYFENKVNTMFLNGKDIPATTLKIIPLYGDNTNLEEYVENYGANRLNMNQINIDFTQQTDSPDHCTYFALKAMHLNKIPVYVDDETLEAGKILGILEEKTDNEAIPKYKSI